MLERADRSFAVAEFVGDLGDVVRERGGVVGAVGLGLGLGLFHGDFGCAEHGERSCAVAGLGEGVGLERGDVVDHECGGHRAGRV
ncbi:hypothetical protein ACIPLC_11630 [Kitasatospora sp. NPDC086801]|uniref:hypothetical protein n=1 Tax=Kitasatospora sp. NPDC086801 TaxID=3364066 RepID=UPI003829009C